MFSMVRGGQRRRAFKPGNWRIQNRPLLATGVGVEGSPNTFISLQCLRVMFSYTHTHPGVIRNKHVEGFVALSGERKR